MLLIWENKWTNIFRIYFLRTEKDKGTRISRLHVGGRNTSFMAPWDEGEDGCLQFDKVWVRNNILANFCKILRQERINFRIGKKKNSKETFIQKKMKLLCSPSLQKGRRRSPPPSHLATPLSMYPEKFPGYFVLFRDFHCQQRCPSDWRRR